MFILVLVNHTDYVGPPRNYKPMELAKKHEVTFDYLQTDEAMPYPPPLKDTSEASVSIMLYKFSSEECVCVVGGGGGRKGDPMWCCTSIHHLVRLSTTPPY